MNRDDFVEQVTAAEATLYHISKSILKNDCDCADAVQEAIMTAYSKLRSLKNDRYFKTWLCRILINECYRICRANKKVVPLEDYMQVTSDQPKNLGLFKAIMELKPDLRLAIVLHYIEGFQTVEISGILKIPEGTVKSRLSRARKQLKSVLGEKEILIHE